MMQPLLELTAKLPDKSKEERKVRRAELCAHAAFVSRAPRVASAAR